MSETLSPETFDFDEWFADAHLPEESADIYTRADVLGRISELSRLIELADDTDDGERTISQKSPSAKLREEYEQLADTFQGSKITVYVRALTGTRRKEILDAHNAEKESDEEFIFRLLSASITAMKKADGDRKDVHLSQADVRNLYGRVGDAQINVLRDAYLTATNKTPEVSADFLPGASSKADTDE